MAVIAREEEDGSALNEFRVLEASNGAGVICDGVATPPMEWVLSMMGWPPKRMMTFVRGKGRVCGV